MRIFCLCVAKNEGDVLEETVMDAARWADGIFISDNQSDDNTTEVIESLVRRSDRVFDAGPLTEPFSDNIRGRLFNRVRHVSRPGDWWCKLDADELYIDDPREFLAAVPAETDTVWGSFFTFYFTDEDLRRYQADPTGFLATPLRRRLHYYKNNESEIRFVKHTFPLIWYHEWPRFRCAASPRRIRIAHYRYRSPEQIVRRLGIRRQVADRTRGGIFPHELGRMPTGAPQLEAVHDHSLAGQEGQAPYADRVIPTSGLDRLTVDSSFVSREPELRPITDLWSETVPFWLWKPLCIARALLSPKRYLPTRARRLLYARR